MEAFLTEAFKGFGLLGLVIGFQCWMIYFIFTVLNKSIRDLTSVTQEHSAILKSVVRAIDHLTIGAKK